MHRWRLSLGTLRSHALVLRQLVLDLLAKLLLHMLLHWVTLVHLDALVDVLHHVSHRLLLLQLLLAHVAGKFIVLICCTIRLVDRDSLIIYILISVTILVFIPIFVILRHLVLEVLLHAARSFKSIFIEIL